MIAPQKNRLTESVPFSRQRYFLKMLPDIRRCALFAFRTLQGDAKEEAIAEMLANVFVAFNRLMERGKRDRIYASVLTRYAIAQIRCGRKVGMSLNSNCILSHAAQLKHKHHIKRLDDLGSSGEWLGFIIEDQQTPVPDQAAFRCDFPEWLKTLSPKNRLIAERLAVGETASNLAHDCKLSRGRISQIRRELARSWQKFHEEPGDCAGAVAATSV